MMKRSILWGTLVCAFLLLLLFSTNASAQMTGKIEGTVVDQYGSPVSGASISLLMNNSSIDTTQTDDNGYYSFEDVEADDYSVRARISASETMEQVSVEPTADNYNFTVDLQFDDWPHGLPDDDDAYCDYEFGGYFDHYEL